MKRRYLTQHILEDLKEKMVFVGGARQVGKTWLAKYIAENHFSAYDYLNWDYRNDRKNIIESRFKGDAEIILFDEIHKYKDWKNYLKGVYDKHKDDFRILVTGSARLDVYRRGGDSLLGRYYYYRLHPFTLAEFLEKKNSLTPFKEIDFHDPDRETYEALDLLLKFGGFPEPLLKQSETGLRRWQNQRVERMVKEDIRDIENIRELSLIQVLVDVLPERAGGLLSINSLREDLSVAYKTVMKWVEVLERFYYIFRIYPFYHNKIRSLKKEPKLYLWDWSEIYNNEGARVENIVASHLLKLCHYMNDVYGYKTELYFLRDVEGREVDFLVTENRKPWFAVEVKSSSREISKTLMYFGERLKVPFLYQVVNERDVDIRVDKIRVINLGKFLVSLV
jgi:predicted AAA+ superfamily ATPase